MAKQLATSPRRGELQTAGETLRFAELDFTDLYLSDTGQARIRGLADGSGPMTTIPEGAVSDLHDLHRKVTHQGQLEDEFPIDHDGVRYRVSKIVSQAETAYALRRLMWPIPRLKTFGFPRPVVREIGLLGSEGGAGKTRGKGLILLGGATGNGKTTTACAILQEYLLAYGNVAVTIEDPPELKLDGPHGAFGHCYQLRVHNGDFATPLRKTMRFNPRYILVGEIRDPEGASMALRAANSGHVVISTIHAGSIEEVYSSMLKFVAADLTPDLAKSMVATGLAGILYQELKTYTTTDGEFMRKASIRSLFVGEDKGIQAKLREGRAEALIQDIEMQTNKIRRDENLFATR